MIGVKISPLKPRVGGFDANASAFFTAAGITDATQKNAVNTLVVGLKSAGLYTKFHALYPIVGGSATSHKFNLINPADTDAAFRLSFVGGWTHSSTGAFPNGTNAYADTFLNANTTLSLDNNHISTYSRTQNAINAVDIGCSNGTQHIDIEILFASRFLSNNTNGYGAGTSAAVTKGFFVNSRLVSTTFKGYKDGALEQTNVVSSTSKPNYKIYIGARNNSGTAGFFAARQCAFASIGTGLTDAEVSTFNTLITNFQTTLGRNV